MQKNLVVSIIVLIFAYTIKEKDMKQSIKEMVMGLLVWSAIIWFCAIDFDMFGKWLKIMFCLVGANAFWWWICDLPNPFKADDDEKA